MIIVDVNLLLYAVIDSFPQHDIARTWWGQTLNDSTRVALTPPSVFGFLRICTNSRVIEPALSIEEAEGYVKEWLDRWNVCFLSPGPRHLDIAFDLLRETGTAGNLTTDAQLAAYAIENDAEVYSNDSDFGRFQGLRWVDPLKKSLSS